MNFFKALSFTKKYIFALSLIASFSILAYFNLSHLIESQADDGEIINISGRQRMLSQKTALFAINYKTKKLQETVELMEKSHIDLLSRKMSKRIKKIYFDKPVMLDKKVKMYVKRAKSFLVHRDGYSLSYILKNSQPLLKDLDSVVSLYQKETENKTISLRQNELYILFLTLFTLTLEALFIFRPANNKVIKKTKELDAQKKYLDTVIQTNTNAIIAVDETLSILTFNNSAQKMFGYSADEMLYTKLIDDKIIPLKYLQMHNNGLANFIKSGKLKFVNKVFELEAQKKDKTLFPIRISFGVNVDNSTKIVVANIQDISKEKAKDDLLLAQSRYAAMGEMIGNIAHQWRQPLSSISTVASGTKIRYKNNLLEDGEVENSFDKIKEYTKHLSNTIDDFRNFFAQSKENDIFDIKSVISQAISLIEATYNSNHIKIDSSILDTATNINGSSSELAQVFLNILNNAKDILVEQEVEEKIVLVKEIVSNNSVVITVTDNAGGIPIEIIHKVYEPYFTTKHKSQGTGIGLFMSKKIIEQNFDGKLSNKNVKFKYNGKHYVGAEFKITLKLKGRDI